MMKNINLTSIYVDHFKDIPIVDENSLKQISDVRKNIASRDRSFLQTTDVRLNLDNISTIPNGRFRCTYKGINFDMLFNFKPDKPLIVVLNGFITTNYPEFKRWSWYPFLQGSMLNIADPMCKEYDDLKLGWYYGNKDIDYRKIIAEIIVKIANFLSIPKNQIIIYASSGGGAVCPEIASIIGNGCTSIAINPQIRLDNFIYYPNFKKITGLNLETEDGSHRNDTAYWVKSATETNFIFVVNIAGKEDRSDILFLADKLNMSLNYGLNKKGNVIIWAYNAHTHSPHTAQEDQYTHFPIFFLKNLFDDTLFSEAENLYILFGEIWNNQWDLRMRIEKSETAIYKINSATKNVLTLKDIDIKPTTSDYNAIIVHDKLLPKTTYTLVINNVTISNSPDEKFAIAVKDLASNSILISEDYSVTDKSIEFSFITGIKTDSLELKVYAGTIGHTNGIALHIDTLTLKQSL